MVRYGDGRWAFPNIDGPHGTGQTACRASAVRMGPANCTRQQPIALVLRVLPRQAVYRVPYEPSGLGDNCYCPIHRNLLKYTLNIGGAVRCNGGEGMGQWVCGLMLVETHTWQSTVMGLITVCFFFVLALSGRDLSWTLWMGNIYYCSTSYNTSYFVDNLTPAGNSSWWVFGCLYLPPTECVINSGRHKQRRFLWRFSNKRHESPASYFL